MFFFHSVSTSRVTPPVRCDSVSVRREPSGASDNRRDSSVAEAIEQRFAAPGRTSI